MTKFFQHYHHYVLPSRIAIRIKNRTDHKQLLMVGHNRQSVTTTYSMPTLSKMKSTFFR